jgi:hypothetical protein
MSEIDNIVAKEELVMNKEIIKELKQSITEKDKLIEELRQSRNLHKGAMDLILGNKKVCDLIELEIGDEMKKHIKKINDLLDRAEKNKEVE